MRLCVRAIRRWEPPGDIPANRFNGDLSRAAVEKRFQLMFRDEFIKPRVAAREHDARLSRLDHQWTYFLEFCLTR